jgi:nitroreductase
MFAAEHSPKAGNLLGLLPHSPYTSAAGCYAQRPQSWDVGRFKRIKTARAWQVFRLSMRPSLTFGVHLHSSTLCKLDEEPMNDSLSRLQQRRSVPARWLGEPGPTPQDIETLLTVAARVPDHGKLVPWRFILIEGEARHRLGETLAAAFQADNPNATAEQLAAERERFSHAPLVVAVVSRVVPHVKIPDWEQVLSAGAVCMNLLNAATALGFGASWLTGWAAFDRRILDVLGLSPTERIAGFVHIGTTKEPQTDRARPNLAEIVTRFQG